MELLTIAGGALMALLNVIIGLAVWGLRSEIALLRMEMRAQLAEAENKFFLRVNGSYVKREIHAELSARVEDLKNRMEDIEQ